MPPGKQASITRFYCAQCITGCYTNDDFEPASIQVASRNLDDALKLLKPPLHDKAGLVCSNPRAPGSSAETRSSE